MRYYISDLHFYHENLNTKMDCRGFSSAEEMNAYMIRQWNSRVRSCDEVVILGDLSMGHGPQTNEVLRQLRGKIYLIEGNHDRYLKDKNFDASRLKWVKPYAEMGDHKRKVVLCHYPVFCYNGQFKVDEQGNPKTYMLYGHVHDTYDEVLLQQFQQITRASKRKMMNSEEVASIPCNMINCFCMYSDYVPLTLDEWIENEKKRREKFIITDK